MEELGRLGETRFYLDGTKAGVTSLSGQMYLMMTTMVTYQVPITLRALQSKRSVRHIVIMMEEEEEEEEQKEGRKEKKQDEKEQTEEAERRKLKKEKIKG